MVALAHGDGSTQKQAVAAMVEAGHAGETYFPVERRCWVMETLRHLEARLAKDLGMESVKQEKLSQHCGKYGDQCVQGFNEGVKHCDRHDKERCYSRA